MFRHFGQRARERRTLRYANTSDSWHAKPSSLCSAISLSTLLVQLSAIHRPSITDTLLQTKPCGSNSLQCFITYKHTDNNNKHSRVIYTSVRTVHVDNETFLIKRSFKPEGGNEMHIRCSKTQKCSLVTATCIENTSVV